MKRAFVGIDLAIAKKKLLPISVCVFEAGKLTPLPLSGLKLLHPRGFGNKKGLDAQVVNQYALDSSNYLLAIQKEYDLSINCIAIDAPSSFRLDSIPRRKAEQEMDKEHISCFATPSQLEFEAIIHKGKQHFQNGGPENRVPHANQIWMLAGFALFRVLKRNFKCIEVFPQAIARTIGASSIHKSNHDGYQRQLGALATLTGWGAPEELASALQYAGSGASHDRLDAFMSAWISYLFSIGKAKPLGELPDDVIWVPDVETISPPEKKSQSFAEPFNIKRLAEPRETTSSEKPKPSGCLCCEKGMGYEMPRICPECGHSFRGLGWGGIDAHWRAHHESTGTSYEQFRESLCEKHR